MLLDFSIRNLSVEFGFRPKFILRAVSYQVDGDAAYGRSARSAACVACAACAGARADGTRPRTTPRRCGAASTCCHNTTDITQRYYSLN